MAGLGCGVKLSDTISAGVQVDYFSERSSGEYNNNHYITFEAGMVAVLSENIRIGMHLFNPVPNSIRKDHQPTTISVGAGTYLNKVLFAGIETEIRSGGKLNVKTGFEYEAAQKLWLRAGFNTATTPFVSEQDTRIGIVMIDLGFSTHDSLE